jgi:hypothetical protein
MRIRSIKPEFCSDEKIGALTREERLHFILLWMLCDRFGVFEYKPRQLAVQLYPYDEDMTKEQFEALTSAVCQKGLCSTFEVLQKCFCRVVNFNKHQKLTTWEHKDSKPLFTAKELRKHCGSTAEVLLSEERSEERTEYTETPPYPLSGDERESEDVPERFKPAFEALLATKKMPRLLPMVIAKVDATFPDFPLSVNFEGVVLRLGSLTGMVGDPLKWLLNALAEEREQKKKRARLDQPLGGEVAV